MSSAYRAMVIRTDLTTEIVQITNFRQISEHLGCDIFCMVPVRPEIQGKYELFGDDEALLVQEPELNPFGSAAYGSDQHGQPIAGNVMAVGPADNMGETTSISDEAIAEIEDVVSRLRLRFPEVVKLESL